VLILREQEGWGIGIEIRGIEITGDPGVRRERGSMRRKEICTRGEEKGRRVKRGLKIPGEQNGRIKIRGTVNGERERS
jgi:hypothetical protein